MATLHYEIELTTPLFSSGAKTNGPVELRPPSIRGAIRFWYRAMMGAVIHELNELQRLEARIFGSTSGRSPLTVRVQPVTINEGRKDTPLAPAKFDMLTYLAGQGLLRYDNQTKTFLLSRNCFLPGSRFRVSFQWRSSELDAVVQGCFRLLELFGGLGARTRRGFGGFRVVKIDGKAVAEKATPPAFKTEIETIRKAFATFAGNSPGPSLEAMPEFSCFAPGGYALEVVPRDTDCDWRDVLDWCGDTLRQARTGGRKAKMDPGHKQVAVRDTLRQARTGGRKTTPDYQNVVRKFINTSPDGSFLGGKPGKTLRNPVFGLPLMISSSRSFRGRGARLVWRRTGGQQNHDRRASPLFIRPVEYRKNRWAVVFLLFKAQLLPASAQATLCPTGRNWGGAQKPRPMSVTLPPDYTALEQLLHNL